MATAVEFENLSKYYGDFCALDHVSLVVEKGTIYGLIGPNGAGKTTLIRLLVGATIPTKGIVNVLGLNPNKDKWKLRRDIGFMPQTPALYEDLSARENILFFGGAYQVQDLERKTTEILEFAELTGRSNDLVQTFSGGMKKRVSLCCALIHNPKIVFLDEPTAAIDPHLKLESWKLFRTLADNGVTLIISTHLMDEALLCDKVAVLRNGKILAVDTPKRILERGETKLRIVESGIISEKIIDSTPDALTTELQLLGLKKEITSVSVHPDSLENIILKITNENKKQ